MSQTKERIPKGRAQVRGPTFPQRSAQRPGPAGAPGAPFTCQAFAVCRGLTPAVRGF